MSRGNKRNNQTVVELEEDIGSASASVLGEQETSMMAMLRLLMKESERKEEARLREAERRDEARRQEEDRKEEARRQEEERREEARLEREAEAARRQQEQQVALEKRQYEQQVALIQLQAGIGKKVSEAHRETQCSDRKRDRALFSVPVHKEGEDLEDFLSVAEGRLTVAGIGKEEWIPIVNSRLSGKLAAAWQDVILTTEEYDEAKGRFLKMCGYTPMLAADRFFGFKLEQCKGLTADQLYHKGQQLARRMLAPGVVTPEVEFSLLRGWVGSVIPRRAKAAMDGRAVTNASDLINAIQDFLVLEGDRCEGKAATFKVRNAEGSKERAYTITCYTCGKVGHRAAECWQGRGGAGAPKTGSSGGVAHKVVCYTCGEEGHKSPQCPQGKGEKDKGARPKPVKRVWQSHPDCVQLLGEVDGHATPILLDSGADISVVPESMVAPERLAGGSVALKPFGAGKPLLLPIANVPFKIGELEWVERVAVAPKEEGVEEEVLYGLNLKSERGLRLVLLINDLEPKEVLRVKTRAQVEAERKQDMEDENVMAQEWARPKEVSIVLDRKEVEKGNLGNKAEEVVLNLDCGQDAYDDDEEEEDVKLYQLREGLEEEPELVVQPVKAGKDSRASLVSETKNDPTLENWRVLCDA